MKTIVFESGKCSHSNCIYCGYSKNEYPVNSQLLKARIDKILFGCKEKELKIFSSGSFLDEKQFPRDFMEYFAEKLRKKGITRLTIESRPEFVTPENLAVFKGIELTVAIGLESAHSDELKTINKGFTLEDFVRAAETIHAHGGKVRTYLLVNIPFVKDIKKSIAESVEFAKKYSDSIVVLNLLPHAQAPLTQLWLQGKWKPLSKKEFRKVVEGIDGIELDEETFKFVPRFPERREFAGVGREFITNDVYDAWQSFISEWYETPDGKDIALFVPCAAKKPYKLSKTHTLIFKALKATPVFKRVHRIVISSPGVIPFEFSEFYPFDSYDWNEKLETPELMEEYVEINKQRIINYLKNHEYNHYFCFFRHDAESYTALKLACEELGITLVNLMPAGRGPQDAEALKALSEGLSGLAKP